MFLDRKKKNTDDIYQRALQEYKDENVITLDVGDLSHTCEHCKVSIMDC